MNFVLIVLILVIILILIIDDHSLIDAGRLLQGSLEVRFLDLPLTGEEIRDVAVGFGRRSVTCRLIDCRAGDFVENEGAETYRFSNRQ